MALANKRRRHAPEQHRRVLRRNHHGSGLRACRTPISIAVGAALAVAIGKRRLARQVLTPGNTVAGGNRDGSRSQRRPPIRGRAKGIARDICQQGRPCILPRRECEANPHALGRANGTLASRSGANLHVHPWTSGEKRLLTRGKRSSILQQHAQRALRQKLREQSQSLPWLHQPQLHQPIKVSPDHPQHRHFRAGHPLKRASTRRHALLRILHRRIEGGQADAGGNASCRDAIEPERPRFAGTSRCDPVIGNAAFRQLASAASTIKLHALTAFRINAATFSRPLASRAQQRLALKTRDERPAVAVELPKIANPSAERGNRHAHKRAAAICGPFPIRHCPIGIRQQHHIICNRSIHARHSSAPPERLRSHTWDLPEVSPIVPAAAQRRPAALSDDRPSETDLSRNRKPQRTPDIPQQSSCSCQRKCGAALDGRTTRRRTWPSGAPGDRNARWRPSRCARTARRRAPGTRGSGGCSGPRS